jgi:hypothetical protein
VTDSATVELCRLIENEIDLGFTYLRTANLASSQEHRSQALGNANDACDNAEHFIGRLPEKELDPSWASRLAELRVVITSISDEQ